eukprot:RCo025343
MSKPVAQARSHLRQEALQKLEVPAGGQVAQPLVPQQLHGLLQEVPRQRHLAPPHLNGHIVVPVRAVVVRQAHQDSFKDVPHVLLCATQWGVIISAILVEVGEDIAEPVDKQPPVLVHQPVVRVPTALLSGRLLADEPHLAQKRDVGHLVAEHQRVLRLVQDGEHGTQRQEALSRGFCGAVEAHAAQCHEVHNGGDDVQGLWVGLGVDDVQPVQQVRLLLHERVHHHGLVASQRDLVHHHQVLEELHTVGDLRRGGAAGDELHECVNDTLSHLRSQTVVAAEDSLHAGVRADVQRDVLREQCHPFALEERCLVSGVLRAEQAQQLVAPEE